MRRRRALWLGLLTAALCACNFRPLLIAEGPDDEPVRAELAAIELRGLDDDRLDYLVRNALLDELNPQSLPVPERYVLDVRVRSRARALGIQLDSTITRYNLSVYATFELRRKDTDDILLGSTVERISSYNVSREPYADLIASHTAERRAADLVGIDISMLLATYFARGEPVT